MPFAPDTHKELISGYISTSASVLYLFESCITFPQEVKVVWSRKWTRVTWLYVCTRYTTLLLQILVLAPKQRSESCKVITLFMGALQLVQHVCFSLFSASRTHALSGNIPISAIVFLLSFVPFVTNIYNYTRGKLVTNGHNCLAVPGMSRSLYLRLSLFTRFAVIASDILVLAVTWAKTLQLYREARRLRIATPLTTLLLRYGSLYFLVLLVINVLMPLSDMPRFIELDFANPFLQGLVPILMCRFILNLRQVRPAGSSFIDGEQSVSLRFMGNMGESLHFGGEEDDGNLDHCSSCVEDSPNAAVGLLTDANVAGNGQLIAGMSYHGVESNHD